MYRLVVLRHGESTWNKENRFTGWTDVDLTEQGRAEAREAGRPILVSPVDGLPEQVGAAGLVIDFTNPDAISRAFAKLDGPRLAEMARAARRSTQDCGLDRQREWARLIRRLAPYQAVPVRVLAPA